MDFNCCFFIVSIVLISGHGSFLISGYNTAKKEEKESLIKKLCRTYGIGFLIISILILLVSIFESVLPASAAFIICCIIFFDYLMIIILENTICKK